jgi:hypothetical protein
MSGLFGSKGSSSSSSNNNSSGTSTTTPNIPGYITGPVSQYYGDVSGLLSSGNPSQYVPPTSANQQTAYNNAGTLGSASSALYGQAANAANAATANGANLSGSTTVAPTTNVAGTTVNPAAQMTAATVGAAPTTSAASLLTQNGGIASYLSPYLNSVVNSTLASTNQTNAQQQAQLEAQGAASNAFGGSRFGVAQSNLAAQQGLNNANIVSGLLNTGYTNAETAANEDADRQQTANDANQSAALSDQQLQANLSQQAGANNQAATNAVSAQQAAINAAAAQQNAQAANSNNQLQANLNQANNQYNASSQNTYDANLLNQAGLLGTLGNDSNASAIADNQQQIAAGQDQRSTEAQQSTANLNYLAALQSLLGVNSSSLFGSTTTGNANSNTNGNSSSSQVGFNGLFG